MTWQYLLGLDFGIRDQCAATVCAWRRYDPIVYIPKSYRFVSYPSKLIEEVRALQAQYDFVKLVGDVGGLGKAFSEEILQRWSVYIEPADKTAKLATIALFNGELQRQLVKIVSPGCQHLLEEMRDLPWSQTKDAPASGYTDHAIDSCIYAWKACRAYLETARPEPQTKEQQIDAAVEAEWARVSEENRRAREGYTDWDGGPSVDENYALSVDDPW